MRLNEIESVDRLLVGQPSIVHSPTNSMVLAVLFDFGGTLDADGLHWLDRFYSIYHQLGRSDLAPEKIKEAFYWADDQADRDPAMKTSGLRAMMDQHVRWQFEKLGLEDPALEERASLAFVRPAERLLRRNRLVLEKLKFSGLKLGIISNFYGNVDALCREFGYPPYLDTVIDSAVVGLKKPDPAIFRLAMDRLGIDSPEQVAFVGDSFERDIVPAKALGMKTFWLIGDQRRVPPDPSKVDVILRSLEDLPLDLKTAFAESK